MKLAAFGMDGRRMPYVVFLQRLRRVDDLRDWYHGTAGRPTSTPNVEHLDKGQMSEWFKRAMAAGNS